MTSLAVAEASSVDVQRVRGAAGGDEVMFATLVQAHHVALVRIAELMLEDEAEVAGAVADTWRRVVESGREYDGRPSIRAWLVGILREALLERASGAEAARSFSAVARSELEHCKPSVPESAFHGSEAGDRVGQWRTPPERWDDLAARAAENGALACARSAVAALPRAQRAVVTLCDVERLGEGGTCSFLGLDPIAQRRLLQSGRARVRLALERHVQS